MLRLFKKKPLSRNKEQMFQQTLEYVKNLDKKEFNRFIDALTLGWQGYDKLLRVQTRDEKEDKELSLIESEIQGQ